MTPDKPRVEIPAASAPTAPRVVDYRTPPPREIEWAARVLAAWLAAVQELGRVFLVLAVAGALAFAYLMAVAFIVGR